MLDRRADDRTPSWNAVALARAADQAAAIDDRNVAAFVADEAGPLQGAGRSRTGELVSRGVAVIVGFGAPASFAAKAATKTIPIDDQEDDVETAAGGQDGVAQENADPIAKTGAWLTQMLQGHLNYYAVSGNGPSLWWYRAAPKG